MGTHPIFESDFDCLTAEKKRCHRKKKKQSKKVDPKVETTMKKLESMDMEDFHSGSAANVKVEDTLVPTIFDWIPEGLDKEAEWVLGIDEAGRGPVLGPMVYSAAISRLERHQEVREELGANDSKQLKEIERERMLKSIDKSGWVAYTGEVLTPAHLSSCMLRQVKYNLNTLSHDTARAMIDRMLNHFKFNIAEIYVDTVGKPEFYQEKTSKLVPAHFNHSRVKSGLNLSNRRGGVNRCQGRPRHARPQLPSSRTGH